MRDTAREFDAMHSEIKYEALFSPTWSISDALDFPELFSQDVIQQRLNVLTEEQNISPIIFEAATSQDNKTCIRMIQEGVDCDILDRRGKSLVHIAAMTGNLTLLCYLSSLSKRVWSKCDKGKIPLDYAALYGRIEVVRYLVEGQRFSDFSDIQKMAILERSSELAQNRGHSMVADYIWKTQQSIRRAGNERLFRDAVFKNDFTEVKELLEDGISQHSALLDACKYGFIPMASLLLSSTFDGFSYNMKEAIKFASEIGQQDLLVLLLCAIDDVSARKLESKEACRHAIFAGKAEICKFLVCCGEVDAQDAFEAISEHQDPDLLQWIVEMEGKEKFVGNRTNDLFHIAVSCSCLPIIRLLVESGANVNSKHEKWGTALQYAVTNNKKELVEYLVSVGGTDPIAYGTVHGSGLLIAAIEAGHTSMFKYLFSHQICRKKLFEVGTDDLLQAASYLGRWGMVEEILNSGIDINAPFMLGEPPLIMAIKGGHSDVAELLISRGANVNRPSFKMGTALHFAAEVGMGGIVKSLIQAGAYVNSIRSELGTPLQAAAANGHELVVLYLLDHGAEVNIQGGKYMNALEAARVNGHDLLARLLLFSGAIVTDQVDSVESLPGSAIKTV